jgi:DNA-3-methyladenine glycosylase II
MQISPAQMQDIVNDLGSRDARFAAVIADNVLCPLGQTMGTVTHFEALVESVTSQQLSVKASDVIYGRLINLAGGVVAPESIVALNETEMRAIGLSGAKVRTIHGLAEAATSGRININQLHEVDDDQHVFDQLTSLWGIGPWTIDMFLMHQLGRLDVWPTGDVGVRRGWQNIYQLSHKIEPNALAVAGEKFRPYRSVVAWYCWREA